MKVLKKTLINTILFFVLGLLPVIPVMSAPVIPDPVYRLEWITGIGFLIIGLIPMGGMSYQWLWYTFVAAFALIILAGYLRKWIFVKFNLM